MEEKIKVLIAEQVKELNVELVGYALSEDKDLQALFKRDFDDSYVVWTGYHLDGGYRAFNHGSYDLDLAGGIKELEKRLDRKLEKGELFMNKVIWTVDNGHEGDSYLIDSEDIEIHSLVGEGNFLIAGIDKEAIRHLDFDRVNQLLRGYELEGGEATESAEEMEVFLKGIGFKDAEVSQSDTFHAKLTDSHLIYDHHANEFYNESAYDLAKVYEFNNAVNPKVLILDGNSGIEEIEVKVTEDYVSLDEWDGRNLVTGGIGLHQNVYKVVETSIGVQKDLYLVEMDSEWTGDHASGEVLNEEELVLHLESLGRDVGEYMTDIKALDGSVYEPETEAEKYIFVGSGDVYLLEDLELDVEKDYTNEDDLKVALDELNEHILTESLEPVRSENGYLPLPFNEDTLVYQVDEGEIHYVTAFDVHDSVENSTKKKKSATQNMER